MIDEENIAETVLSPDSHDSGIHIESQYSRPIKVDESQSLLMNPPLPPGWEKHEGIYINLELIYSRMN